MVKDRLLSYEEALAAILSRARTFGTEGVGLSQAIGRVLSEPVFSVHPMPRFDNSAVDGFAISEADRMKLEESGSLMLDLGKTVAAGDPIPEAPIAEGVAAYVLTGARVPERTSAIVMQEDAVMEGTQVRLSGSACAGQHIRFAGEEYEVGTELLPANTLLNPAGASMAASSGKRDIRVWRRPKVGMLFTGNELTPPGYELHGTQIYESNSYGIEAALRELGIESFERVHSPDVEAPTVTALGGLVMRNDVVITSGGVSVGQYDTVKSAMKEAGIQTEFWGVAIKPGKPFYFGLFREDGRTVPVFGLPGNPMSALVTFAVLVEPFLRSCQGLDPLIEEFEGRTAKPLRKKKGRLEFVPTIAVWRDREWVLEPLERRGSHMLGGLAFANSWIKLPPESDCIEAGGIVSFVHTPWRSK
ncbi:MAG: molybdopterin molybdotransferase MoeA [Fimbriimonadaceae bacterium]|nr:molybdopterin molybdotransferase MoeA [Fimbriimonadaceae bacterium]